MQTKGAITPQACGYKMTTEKIVQICRGWKWFLKNLERAQTVEQELIEPRATLDFLFYGTGLAWLDLIN